jgi:hypothetical protein
MVALGFLIFSGFVAVNLSWYLYLARKEEEHKRVCEVNERVIAIREKEIEILKGYMNDVCSGDINREENAKYQHRFKSGWQGSMGNDAWIKNQERIFHEQTAEMVMAGSRPTIDEEQVSK